MSEWLDPVESTRDLIAALEKDRGACEAEIVDLAAEREAVLRAMGEAASRLELQETKIALQGQGASSARPSADGPVHGEEHAVVVVVVGPTVTSAPEDPPSSHRSAADAA
ncbi:hypothetical protein JL721_11931 [Aureococcus anophagefferens]|nr:hypothetical protein JL721_11931 [Aureococcus anophagefferens]